MSRELFMDNLSPRTSCGHRGCLIADRDGTHASWINDERCPSGSRGSTPELQLHTIRARMTCWITEQGTARSVSSENSDRPANAIRSSMVRKTPIASIEDRLDRFFTMFLRLRFSGQSAVCERHELGLPRRASFEPCGVEEAAAAARPPQIL